jgi:hypothetical protein
MRVIKCVSSICGILWIIILTIQIRSYCSFDSIHWDKGYWRQLNPEVQEVTGRSLYLSWSRGSICFGRVERTLAVPSDGTMPHWEAESLRRQYPSRAVFTTAHQPPMDLEERRDGVPSVLGVYCYSNLQPGGEERILMVPSWPFSLLFGVVLSVHCRSAWRKARRLRQGQCLGCGYDLRGSKHSQRCPECGGGAAGR